MYTGMRTYTYVRARACMHAFIYAWMRVCMYTCTRLCTLVYVRACMRVYVHLRMCTSLPPLLIQASLMHANTHAVFI
jgi:hypothetical protein